MAFQKLDKKRVGKIENKKKSKRLPRKISQNFNSTYVVQDECKKCHPPNFDNG